MSVNANGRDYFKLDRAGADALFDRVAPEAADPSAVGAVVYELAKYLPANYAERDVLIERVRGYVEFDMTDAEREKWERKARKAYRRGKADRAAYIVDADALQRGAEVAQAEYDYGIRHEGREAFLRSLAAGRLDHTIRESMSTHEQLRAEPPLQSLVEGILPQRSMATLVGASGLGKTALGASMAAAIAMRKPWMGRATVGGPVIYCLAEGGAGFRARLDAIASGFYGGKSIEDLIVVRRPIDMSDTNGEVAELREIVAEVDPALVVYDTLIRYAGGADENSSTQMSIVLANMEWVTRAGTRTTGLAVHHTGHEGKRARGTSAIFANVDTELTLSGEPDALRLHVTKQKDGREGLVGDFRLKASEVNGAVIVEGVAPGQSQPSGAQAARVEEALAHFVRAFGPTGATRPEFRDALMEWMEVSKPTALRYIADLVAARRLNHEERGRSSFLTLAHAPTTFPLNNETE